LRVLKGFLYVTVGAIPAAFSARSRDRLVQNAKVLAWHLRGCPEDAGLRPLRGRPRKQGGNEA
ncbi:MAG: hypothetical protein R3263_01530, partial [Myxococcota bacterium]|nr:hypothetical protein [Myxococcota bacterium]